jgi:hypothetical protein
LDPPVTSADVRIAGQLFTTATRRIDLAINVGSVDEIYATVHRFV